MNYNNITIWGQESKAGREWYAPYQSKDPNPTKPAHREKEDKELTVKYKEGASSIVQ